jgi:hypothetical protein
MTDSITGSGKSPWSFGEPRRQGFDAEGRAAGFWQSSRSRPATANPRAVAEQEPDQNLSPFVHKRGGGLMRHASRLACAVPLVCLGYRANPRRIGIDAAEFLANERGQVFLELAHVDERHRLAGWVLRHGGNTCSDLSVEIYPSRDIRYCL